MLAALTSLQLSSHDLQFHHFNKSSKASASAYCIIAWGSHWSSTEGTRVMPSFLFIQSERSSRRIGEVSHLLIINGTNVTWQMSTVTSVVSSRKNDSSPIRNGGTKLWIVMDLNNSFLNTIRYVSRETRLLYAITTSRISTFYIIGSSVESPIFCDDNAFCTSYIASSQTTCIQNLLLMPPVVIDLSNRSRNPSFTNVDTGIIHRPNGTRWHWHNGTGTSSGIKVET